jgi:hypothetical protein
VVVLLLASLACRSLPGAAISSSATQPPATDQPAATAGLTATDADPAPTARPEATASVEALEEIVAEGEVILGPGTFNFRAPAVGLGSLGSYKATLTLSFEGTEAGQASEWSRTYVMLSVREPATRLLMSTATGQVPDPEPVTLAERDGAAYEQHGDGACAANPIDPGQGLADVWEPASFLAAVVGAEEAGSETANGVPAQHYRFDQRALGLQDVVQSTGELWVAADGGYLVRYYLSTTAGPSYFGDGIEGTAVWSYELTEINQPQAINLPAGCPAGLLDVPALPDAADLVSEPGWLGYVTASPPGAVLEFYQAQLPPLGWQPAGAAITADSLAAQDFNRGDQQLSLTITTDASGTVVALALGPVQP